ncbi:hypothetical protein BMS3Abin07_00478 [bacterium BMS3Abin07]|nr:hypothetical protein BMS3Abin07_00478 [bacterium BMS3Abin07]GBE31637.1 hypothetical protein BMS3Bbin05_00540 [bacterium BMS3Bbin05]HDO21327.1 hypothetical protein [Nitrospirota bacterium]
MKFKRHGLIAFSVIIGMILLFNGTSWSGGVVFEETKVVIETGHLAEKEFQFSVSGAKKGSTGYMYTMEMRKAMR